MKGIIKKSHLNSLIIILGIFFVIGLWFLLSWVGDSYLIPNPLKTFSRVIILLSEPQTYVHLYETLKRLTLALLISFAFGSFFGVFGGLFHRFHLFFKPLIITLRTLPTASVILIFISLTRIMYAPIYVVFLITFPLSYEAMVAGITHIDESVKSALKLEGEYSFKAITKVTIPLTLPYIFLGLVQSLGLGMKVVIMAEILTGSRTVNGLGFALRLAYEDVNYLDIFAYSVLAVILIGLVEVLLNIVKKKVKKST